ncbi:MAG: MlaD family protein [Desulfobacterales bacterium]|jgi:paraquat-inducible protein B
MSKKGNTAVIGAFVIGAIVLAVVGILAFGSGALFKKTDTFVLFFDGDLKGLSVGAPVLFRGVPVGAVKDIRVYYKSSQAEFRIPVFIETDPARFHDLEDSKDLVPDEIDPPELDRLIKAGLRGRLTLQSPVTGQLAVLLDLLPDTPVNLQGDGRMPEIPTVPSSIERLAGALEKLDLGTLVANVNRAMAALERMIEQEEIEKLVADLQGAANEVANLAREVRERSVILTDQIGQTAQTARSMMQSIDRQVDPVAGETVRTMAQIQQTMVRAEEALASLDRLAADYSGESAFNHELSFALEEFAATARSLRALTDMLQQQPDVLLRGKPVPGGN